MFSFYEFVTFKDSANDTAKKYLYSFKVSSGGSPDSLPHTFFVQPTAFRGLKKEGN